MTTYVKTWMNARLIFMIVLQLPLVPILKPVLHVFAIAATLTMELHVLMWTSALVIHTTAIPALYARTQMEISFVDVVEASTKLTRSVLISKNASTNNMTVIRMQHAQT